MNDMASTILIAIGVLFNLFGCIGLIRLPDVYN
ncbi:MAG: monovalent cation/H(+) antiporter subunit G, partial [Bacteroidales bacterium]